MQPLNPRTHDTKTSMPLIKNLGTIAKSNAQNSSVKSKMAGSMVALTMRQNTGTNNKNQNK